MRAAILRNKAMVVDDIADLSPAAGQVLVQPIACGICGSDLHTVDHAHDLVASSKAAGYATFGFDPDQDLVMGHELSVRVIGLGAGVTSVVEGDAYAAMPFLVTTDGRRAIPGYDNVYPGGYAEQMLLDPRSLVPVPNGLDPAMASLTEPMAVGLHAVNESGIVPGRAAIVIGAGPVGLAVTAALAANGIEPIIVADFSPTRRRVATQLGAHVVVDPGERSVFDAWREVRNPSAKDEGGRPVIFEAVGVPGMIDRIMLDAPNRAELVVVGVCMSPDTFRPTLGIYKHLTLRFVLGWSPQEFIASLDNLAEGRIDGAALVTGEVGIEGVPQAFADLGDPEQHVKILVRPDL
jgi:threonine dehydrogenase-like Zn-dependent dehydrogenase